MVFGILFEECSTIFEALSGTLKTAKKHGVKHVHTVSLISRIKFMYLAYRLFNSMESSCYRVSMTQW